MLPTQTNKTLNKLFCAAKTQFSALRCSHIFYMLRCAATKLSFFATKSSCLKNVFVSRYSLAKFLPLILITICLFAVSQANARSLNNAIDTAASAMKAQSERIKVVTENIANVDTTGISPDEDPYRRKNIFFENVQDKKTGANLLRVRKIGEDQSEFKKEYNPNHPAADAEGYIRTPNVDRTLESVDLRDAQRSYEANLSAIETSRGMTDRALDLMR
jgi:flagellar basal-body rod protein FlgC